MSPTSPDDRDLHEAFAALRESDDTRTPDSGSVMARARAEAARVRQSDERADPSSPAAPARRRLNWAVPGLSVAMAAAVATLILVDRHDEGADFDRVVEAWVESGAGWSAPTDDLLRMPGDEILRTVPRIGGIPSPLPPETDAPPVDGPGRESPS